MSRNIPNRQFFAFVIMVLLLLTPLLFSWWILNGEPDQVDLGLSTEVVAGIESEGDLKPVRKNNLVDGVHVFDNALGSVFLECRGPTGIDKTRTIMPTSFSDIPTEESTFGTGYAFTPALIEDVSVCDDGPLSGGIPSEDGEDILRLIFYWSIPVEKVIDSEILTMVFHGSGSFKVHEMVTAIKIQCGEDWPNPCQQFDNFWWEGRDPGIFSWGEPHSIPISTFDRISLMDTPEPFSVGRVVFVQVHLFLDRSDMPANGEGIIWDMELSKTREGIFDNTGSLIAFNLAWSFIAVPVVLFASPLLSIEDFRASPNKRNRRK